jgi:hypothetical protein
MASHAESGSVARSINLSSTAQPLAAVNRYHAFSVDMGRHIAYQEGSEISGILRDSQKRFMGLKFLRSSSIYVEGIRPDPCAFGGKGPGR